MVNVKQLVARFANVFEKHKDFFPKEGFSTVPPNRRVMVIFPKVIFVDESLDALDDLIDYLAGEKWILDRYTRKDVQRMVTDKIVQGIELSEGKLDVPKEFIPKLAEELLDELNRPPTKWTVIAPFNNIVLKSDPYRVGNVNFYRYKKENLENVKGPSRIRETMWSKLGDRLVGEVEVSASNIEKAEEMAQMEYDLAISLLRVVYPQATITFESFFLTRERDEQSISFSREIQWDFNFGERNLEEQVSKLKEIINPVISGNLDNEMSRRCLQALRWYGMAVRDSFAPDKFVKFVTALEVLVLTGKHSGKCGLTEEFGENLSILIVHPGKSRKQIKKEMKEIYGIRSSIVHRADYSRLKEEHITRVQNQCRVIILALVENISKFENFEKLLEHMTELRSKTS